MPLNISLTDKDPRSSKIGSPSSLLIGFKLRIMWTRDEGKIRKTLAGRKGRRTIDEEEPSKRNSKEKERDRNEREKLEMA